MSKESSISVTVRVRPFTSSELRNLVVQTDDRLFIGDGSLSSDPKPVLSPSGIPRGIRKVVSVVDDRMLIFDPPETNPLAQMQQRAFPNGNGSGGGGGGSRIREHRFVFDRLFDSSADQAEIYEQTTKPLLNSILDGFNATVFAYGATGCGKTHTISGSIDQPGVIFLTMQELFAKIEELQDSKIVDVSLLYLEIYNETIRDLLSPETPFKKLVIREDAMQKISVSNLSSHKPTSVDEVMDLIMFGNSNRTSSPTEANLTSSRSHAVLQINVIQRLKSVELLENHTYATLSIIDLAGSERAAATKNRGARLNEGANINKSLLALGNCINSLCDPRRRNHVPYRDSKLTRLLKFSLGGNCKTVMIVCISPSLQHYDETLNTLKYADRAKEIKTKVIRNQHNLDRHVGSYLKMITEQKQEIEDLKSRENKVLEKCVTKERNQYNKCLLATLENIDNLNLSLSKHTQEKWKKYHLLAKRKLLLLQKVEAQRLLSNFDNVNENCDELVLSLLEQLISKTSTQVTELENQYSGPNDTLDMIFNELVRHSLRKLKELDGWSENNTSMFEFLVSAVRESLEKEILFNSSILFDYLIHQLEPFSQGLVDGVDKTVLIEKFQDLVNGEYDSLIEEHTSDFMRLKLELIQQPKPHQKHTHISTKRDARSRSPLKTSPPTKKLPPITSIPRINLPNPSKRVRWEENAAIPDSDTSMDEQSHSQIFMSDSHMDISTIIPSGNELDLSFNPIIESPPSASKPIDNTSILSELHQTRLPTSIPIKSFINQPPPQDRRATTLLNKEGAKVTGRQESSDTQLKLSLGTATRLLNGVE